MEIPSQFQSALTHLFFISLADETAVESKIPLHQKDDTTEERSSKDSISLSKSEEPNTMKLRNDRQEQEATINITGSQKRKKR